jgi:hypothetical protein
MGVFVWLTAVRMTLVLCSGSAFLPFEKYVESEVGAVGACS